MSAVPPVAWDEEVQIVVTVRVRGGGEQERDYQRTAADAAMTAILTGRSDLSDMDGFADLSGSADIIDVEPWP